MEKLPGDYVAGFVDGEGCFYINFRRDVRHERKNKPVYFYWDTGFAITLRGDDKDILEKIKISLNCGRLSFDKRGQVRYEVTDLNDLISKVVPFFDKYTLRAKKSLDYQLWKEALVILQKNRQVRVSGQRGFTKIQWDPKDAARLRIIKTDMELYKSTKAKQHKWSIEI